MVFYWIAYDFLKEWVGHIQRLNSAESRGLKPGQAGREV